MLSALSSSSSSSSCPSHGENECHAARRQENERRGPRGKNTFAHAIPASAPAREVSAVPSLLLHHFKFMPLPHTYAAEPYSIYFFAARHFFLRPYFPLLTGAKVRRGETIFLPPLLGILFKRGAAAYAAGKWEGEGGAL